MGYVSLAEDAAPANDDNERLSLLSVYAQVDILYIDEVCITLPSLPCPARPMTRFARRAGP
jgi:hypothetical protein